ncbi:lactonase family protein [Actinosynnema sp. NPDC020468]|uniref:lactonase family protein n=1 Tax=Actinosynnema sp. NPDC020468 TaxID=3154488 RepID=UPI003400E112
MVVNRRQVLGAAGVGAGLLMTEGVAGAQGASEIRVYLGTYTSWDGGGPGIGLGVFDRTTGVLRSTGAVAGVANPSFVIEAGNLLYAVDEQPAGAVTALALGADGVPTVLNSTPTGGGDPCHLTVFQGHLLTANYSTGSVSVHPLGADGSVQPHSDLVVHQGHGPDSSRQAGPHAHQVVSDVKGEYVLAVDLGTDSVYTYKLSATGKLTRVSTAKLKAGAGPRHLAFAPSGKYAYIANELDSTLTVATYDKGVLKVGASVRTAPAGSVRNYPAEVLVSADGKFVYVSNRGHDSVAVFAVSGASVNLVETVPVGGKYPRDITLDSTGRFLFAGNQNSNNVTVFAVDPTSGRLSKKSTFDAPIPVCVALKG